jgi:ATP-dependent DNA helicase DinG
VRRDRDVCLGPRGPFWESCLYRLDLARAREADCLVVNHALFFRDLATGGRILPPHDVAILDEAHRAEEAAAAQSGVSIGPAAVSRLLLDVRRAAGPAGRRRGRGAGDGAERVGREADLFFAEARRVAEDLMERRAPGRRGTRSEADTWSARLPAGALTSDRLLQPLRDLERSLESQVEGAAEALQQQTLAALALRSRDLRERLEMFLSQKAPDTVYWAEGPATGRGCTLRALPIEVAPMLRQRLFESRRTVVLTSATLTAGGSFAHLRARLGITSATEVALGSPYDYARQALLYLPGSMPDPVSEPAAFGDAVASECRRLIAASDGGALVLFTSYALLRRVHAALSEEPALRGMPIFRHAPDGTATALLEGFRSGRRGVLLGTLTFWQGVDVPGEALRCVIITRLPFEVPDHPAAAARAELIQARGADPFAEDSLPEAVLTFRQGFGRLIRSGEDRGVVAVLDPRLTTRGYGATFLESLPACPRTSSLEEVARFFAVS